MKKSMKLFIMFFFATLIFSFIGYNSYPQIYYEISSPIYPPDNIFVYSYNRRIEIKKDSPIFHELVSETNKRLTSDLYVVTDIVDDRVINEYKKERFSLEFIYNKEQSLPMFSYGKNIYYHKLFFPLVSSKFGTEQYSFIYSFQYGNKEHYIDSSRGPLTNPEGIIELIQGFKNK